MQIQPAGNGSYYIYLKDEELGELPAPPGALSARDAAALVRRALGGNQELSNYCLELYEGQGAMLLFARAPGAGPAYFAFTELDRLLDAVKLCRAGLVSLLLYCDGTYFLAVYPDVPFAGPPAVLSEFGEELKDTGYFALYLAEHGKILAGPDAIDMLNRVF